MPKYTFIANQYVQLGSETKPAAIPMTFTVEYAEKAISDYVWTTAQTNAAVAQGSVDKPRVVVIEVTEGTIEVANNNTGDGALTLSANATPQAGDPPATLVMFTFSPATAQYYVTTTGPAKAKFSFFG